MHGLKKGMFVDFFVKDGSFPAGRSISGIILDFCTVDSNLITVFPLYSNNVNSDNCNFDSRGNANINLRSFEYSIIADLSYTNNIKEWPEHIALAFVKQLARVRSDNIGISSGIHGNSGFDTSISRLSQINSAYQQAKNKYLVPKKEPEVVVEEKVSASRIRKLRRLISFRMIVEKWDKRSIHEGWFGGKDANTRNLDQTIDTFPYVDAADLEKFTKVLIRNMNNKRDYTEKFLLEEANKNPKALLMIAPYGRCETEIRGWAMIHPRQIGVGFCNPSPTGRSGDTYKNYTCYIRKGVDVRQGDDQVITYKKGSRTFRIPMKFEPIIYTEKVTKKVEEKKSLDEQKVQFTVSEPAYVSSTSGWSNTFFSNYTYSGGTITINTSGTG